MKYPQPSLLNVRINLSPSSSFGVKLVPLASLAFRRKTPFKLRLYCIHIRRYDCRRQAGGPVSGAVIRPSVNATHSWDPASLLFCCPSELLWRLLHAPPSSPSYVLRTTDNRYSKRASERASGRTDDALHPTAVISSCSHAQRGE